jgi:hypothetical protein
MRRRVPEPRAGGTAPFVAPQGDYIAVWAAYEAWDVATADHLAAHPGDAEAVELAHALTVVPDAPLDVSDI